MEPAASAGVVQLRLLQVSEPTRWRRPASLLKVWVRRHIQPTEAGASSYVREEKAKEEPDEPSNFECNLQSLNFSLIWSFSQPELNVNVRVCE